MNGTNSFSLTQSIGVGGNISACSGFHSRNVFDMHHIQPLFPPFMGPLLGQAPSRRGFDPLVIEFPQELTMAYQSGRQFLQIPGPTNVPDRVLRALSRPTMDHRGAE